MLSYHILNCVVSYAITLVENKIVRPKHLTVDVCPSASLVPTLQPQSKERLIVTLTVWRVLMSLLVVAAASHYLCDRARVVCCDFMCHSDSTINIVLAVTFTEVIPGFPRIVESPGFFPWNFQALEIRGKSIWSWKVLGVKA